MNRFFTLLLAASCLTAVGQVPDYVPTDGLVAWWGFSGNASDLSGNGNHLTIHNQVHFMDVNANRDGIYLDGSPSYLSCIPFVGIGTGASHTLAFWTAGEMSPGGRYALAEFNGNPQLAQSLHHGIRTEWPCNGGFLARMDFYNGGANSGCLVDTAWTHWTMVYDRSDQSRKIYQNGTLITDTIGPDYMSNLDAGVLVGAHNYEGEEPGRFNTGFLDDIGVWNRPLSALEITLLFETQIVYGCTDLSACNYNPSANIENGTCGSCEALASACGEGTMWDAELGKCIVANPSDSNFDGCVQLNDLLDLLSAYGDCGAEESAWQCGDLLEYQGYDYETVLIGEQCWFAENLRVESYRNGEAIPSIALNGGWEAASFGLNTIFGDGTGNCSEASPAFDACNPELSLSAYGRLYNGFAVIDERGLCPIGWATPGDDEWIELFNFLGGFPVAGEKMKSVEGWFDGVNGTNSSGFNGLPGGKRNWTGSFFGAGESAYFWSHPPQFYVLIDTPNISTGNMDADHGHSVRCIKDTE